MKPKVGDLIAVSLGGLLTEAIVTDLYADGSIKVTTVKPVFVTKDHVHNTFICIQDTWRAVKRGD